MKIQVRHNVFETNSSSVHSLTMCSESTYEKWKRGEIILYGCDFSGKFMAIDEAKMQPYFNERYIQTYEQFCSTCLLESFEDSFTTENGDTVIAFGVYGYD